MPTYKIATREIENLANDILSEHYHDLAEAGVTVEILTAHAAVDSEGQPKGPALKLHGYQCAGIVKVNSLKDRVAGLSDARIIVDGDRWGEWSDERKRAVIHHELHHLELVHDEEGTLLTDDANRPRLKLKLHDWELGGFATIGQQYGEHAPEVEMFRAAADQYGQMLFSFAQEEKLGKPRLAKAQ